MAATWCSAIVTLLAVGQGLGRPEPPVTGFGSSGGNLQLDSYAAPISGGSSGSYPSGGPPPMYGPPVLMQAPVIHKHVYVHVPPPEPTTYVPKRPVQPPQPPQKHYKIVFIKAPTPPTPTAPEIPPLPPAVEQKTLIYVLVKKPEEQPEIHIPTPAPTQPSKPEVYFIRYKTQKQEGYPNSVANSEYGPPASPSPSIGPSESYGSPSPSTGYGAPSGPGSGNLF
ncbi:uncharacterized protein LOC126894793 [Daktulosphaira vitifoliae]|uniref:uncharacterized protein LOC126894793 n=1 Tax=Daktulosphaira vitifoliae TaxID=58002 RepID=UPI0021A9B5D1|nr:uncharacterized protein LOC126894793 [Daktulosphaira vitifoliae]